MVEYVLGQLRSVIIHGHISLLFLAGLQDGDKFCWNEECWLSPVFGSYCKTDADEASPASPAGPASPTSPAKSPSQERKGYMNSFGRETIIDYALTSALQAPVKVHALH